MKAPQLQVILLHPSVFMKATGKGKKKTKLNDSESTVRLRIYKQTHAFGTLAWDIFESRHSSWPLPPYSSLSSRVGSRPRRIASRDAPLRRILGTSWNGTWRIWTSSLPRLGRRCSRIWDIWMCRWILRLPLGIGVRRIFSWPTGVHETNTACWALLKCDEQ